MQQRNRKPIIFSCIATIVGVTACVGVAIPTLSQTRLQANSTTTKLDPNRGKPASRAELIQAIKQRVPGFFTYDDLSPELKARAVRKNGSVVIKFSKGETATLPNGDRLEADGSWVKKSGVKFQPVVKDGKFSGRYRIFKPDGTEVQPGEDYTAPDGMKIRVNKTR